MKILLTLLITAISLLTVTGIIPAEEDFEIYDSTLRLHVIANSDSENDQTVKLKVRDAILETVSTYNAESREQAMKMIEERREELEAVANAVLAEEGLEATAEIEIGQEIYPTRQYENFSLPSGEYTSVKVVIGEGKGKNWWCVLYPPLCTASAIKYDDEATVEVGLTKNQYDLITSNKSGQYKIKFKLLEIAAEAFKMP